MFLKFKIHFSLLFLYLSLRYLGKTAGNICSSIKELLEVNSHFKKFSIRYPRSPIEPYGQFGTKERSVGLKVGGQQF